MRDSRIPIAFVFGLVGGVLILVVALVFLPSLFSPYGFGPFAFGPFGFSMAISSGILVIVSAAMAFRKPAQGVAWGIVMVIFGSLSAFGLAGFGVGLGLAVAGGALAIVSGASPTLPAAGMQRACTSCGMLFDASFPHCPYCGHAVAASPRAAQ